MGKRWNVKPHHPQRKCPRCGDSPMDLDWDHSMDIIRRRNDGDVDAVYNPWMKRVCFRCDYVVYESYLRYLEKENNGW